MSGTLPNLLPGPLEGRPAALVGDGSPFPGDRLWHGGVQPEVQGATECSAAGCDGWPGSTSASESRASCGHGKPARRASARHPVHFRVFPDPLQDRLSFDSSRLSRR